MEAAMTLQESVTKQVLYSGLCHTLKIMSLRASTPNSTVVTHMASDLCSSSKE
jgi:hypothetical protein